MKTLGMRLGPLFRLPNGNLLGHQTKSLGSKGDHVIIFNYWNLKLEKLNEWKNFRAKVIGAAAVGVASMASGI
jgi:hypothetical protein